MASSDLGTTHLGLLLDRIRKGDSSAQDQLINDAFDRMHHHAHLILKGRKPCSIETDDIICISLQKFSVKLRGGMERVPDNAAELFAYVGRIIRRVAIDEIRSGHVRQAALEHIQAEPYHVDKERDRSTQPCESSDLLGRIRFEEMIESLPEDEQRLVNFRYLQRMTDVEIGSLLGCDRSTVSNHLRAILRKLHRHLGPDA